MKHYVGIDNGTSGTIGIIKSDDMTYFIKTPSYLEQSYTKTKKQNISRVKWQVLLDFFITTLDIQIELIHKPKYHLKYICDTPIFVGLERPLVNGKFLKTTQSAMRAIEATLIVLEMLDLSKDYIDSKQWQKELLPPGTKGTQLKYMSRDIGCRLFPQHKDIILKSKTITKSDADGILIAEYCRRHRF